MRTNWSGEAKTENVNTKEPCRIFSFDPIVGKDPLVLILGSAPSIRSLATRQYYGHERNCFWKLVCAVLEEPLRESYAERVALLRRRQIALWDSVRSCVRPGSLDKDIREEEPNDIAGLLERNPTVRAVCFNGQAAWKLYRKYNRGATEKQMTGMTAPELLLLPSSSPVPRRAIKTFEDRLEKWLQLRRFLER